MPKTNLAQIFSPEKQGELEEMLEGVFKEDIWPHGKLLETLSRPNVKQGYNYRFKAPWHHINVELKYALQELFRDKVRTPGITTARTLSLLIRFISSQHNVESLVAHPLQRWLLKLRTFLRSEGKAVVSTMKSTNRRGETFTSPVTHKSLGLFKLIYEKLADHYDPRDEWHRRYIDLSRVCKSGDKRRCTRIDMGAFKQEWLRKAFIEHIKHRTRGNTAPGTLQGHYTHVVRFSRDFLARRFPGIKPADVDRHVLEEYLSYVRGLMRQGKLSQNVGVNAVSYLKTFIGSSQRQGVLTLAPDFIFLAGDIPKSKKGKPRWIPEFVVYQIMKHLHRLELKWRLPLMLQLESGGRVGEILGLPIACLRKDDDGDYWLRRFVSKQSKWHAVPMAAEIVALIREWGTIVKERHGDTTGILFPGARGDVSVSQQTYQKQINLFIRECGIVGEDGVYWHFKSHDCRHTLATDMLDKGIAFHIICDFLGHGSPEMTRVYAAMRKARTKEVQKKVHARRAEVTGAKEFQDWEVADVTLAKMVKKHTITQRLPNGFCCMSVHQASCISGSICLECEDFETTPEFLPVHRKELDDELAILAAAEKKEHVRQIEASEDKIAKLTAVVEDLEAQIGGRT